MASYVGTLRIVRYVALAALLGSTGLMGAFGTQVDASMMGPDSAVHGAAPHLSSSALLSPLGSVNVCGKVTAYTPATALTAGSITIGGQTYAIAKGVALTGVTVLLATDLCLSAQLNASGQIENGSVSADVGASVSVCGLVTAYTAATVVTPGLLSVGGEQLVLAPGATLSGAPITVGADLCLKASTNGLAQVTNGTVTVNAPTTVTVCGTVTAYVAATATTPGSVSIAGQTFTIAPGTTLSGGPISVGADVSATLTVDAPATIVGGTVSLGGCTSGTAVPTATSTAGGALPTQTPQVGGVATTATAVPTGTQGSSTATATAVPGESATATTTGGGTQPTPTSTTSSGQPTATPSATSGSGSGSPTITEYLLPGGASGTQHGHGPWQFARDRHGNVWFTEYLVGAVGEILAGTHTLHEYRLHGPHTYPMGITTDRAGHIWVVERAGNRIDRLVVKRGYATLTSWQLPHAYSGPQEIALGAGGTLWLTERASRIARFNPRTHVLREYSLSRGLQPYGIVVTGQGPTFVNENANLQGWARVLANGRVQLRVKPLPWAGSDPTLVARAHNSSYVAMPMADGFARLRQPGQVTMTVRPSTAKLKGVSQRRSLTTYRLTQLVSKVHVVTRMARRIARNGSVLYRLPPHPGRPFDVKLDPHGKQVWLSEQRVPIVAATTLKSHRVVDYTLSRPDAGLRGILVTKRFGGVRVWIAEFQANRIGVLNAP